MLEATGGVERGVTRALASAELPVVVVNRVKSEISPKPRVSWPRPIHIDAVVLARFAEAVRPAVRPFPDEITLELRALIARRRQITEMIVAENNRLGGASRAVKKRIDAHIRWLETELDRADKDLDQSIRHSPIWCISQHII